MTMFTERVRNSETSRFLAEVAERLDELTRGESKPQETQDALDRLKAVVTYVRSRLTIGDARLVPPDTVSAMQHPAEELNQQVTSFAEQEELAMLTSANTAADNLLVAARELPAIPIRSTGDVLQRAADAYTAEVESARLRVTEQTNATLDRLKQGEENLEASKTEALEHLKQGETSLEAAKTEVAEQIRQGQETVEATKNQATSEIQAAAETTRQSFEGVRTEVTESEATVKKTATETAEEVRATASEVLTRVQDSAEKQEREVTATQEVFRQAQEGRAQQFEASQLKASEERAERLANLSDEFAVLVSGMTAQRDVAMETLRASEEQALEILASVGGVGQAEQYLRQHERQRGAADRWRLFGVAALVGLIGVGGLIFFDSSIRDRSFSDALTAMLGKSTLVLSLAALATYLLKQSGHHRQREEDTGRLSSELMMMGTFINRLPEADRNEVLRVITPGYFRGGLAGHDPGDRIGLMDAVRQRMPWRPGKSGEDEGEGESG